ncbi:11248_t:CDS:2, partial [Gigaspora margarita]
LVHYGKDLTPQELKDSVNHTIFSNIDEVSYDSNHEFSLSNTQELPPPTIHELPPSNIQEFPQSKDFEQTDQVLAISEITIFHIYLSKLTVN